ncbi:ethylene-responsive transcription factor RAP2-12-like [Gossypium australe]|uniref:Ethylene-responsive transcription factor RAP2-12-like n=1 Tax=Gossypium australe TaxID=47621 RepID=A0A5B6WCM0_9ROSI|nr:ethylene-responsive transcription factor RAP2-12-like [Gossypium australe]
MILSLLNKMNLVKICCEVEVKTKLYACLSLACTAFRDSTLVGSNGLRCLSLFLSVGASFRFSVSALLRV